MPDDVRERFFSKVEMSDGCWTWTASLNADGYGQFAPGRPQGAGANWRHCFLAHRVSWEMHNGPIPAGLCVLHRCDNPSCVRPNHLFLGTIQDNNRDMVEKGHYVNAMSLVTHCPRGHAYTGVNLRRHGPNGKWRSCRLCRAEGQRERRKHGPRVQYRSLKSHCVRGHELSGDNLRMVGRMKERTCRECQRIRCRDYRARTRRGNG